MQDAAVIDTRMFDQERVTGAFLVRGDDAALVETGSKATVENVLEGLRDNGVDELRWILVTHIHLDHAGAAGTIAARFPEARVVVHPVGAPHLVDPTKLWSSASRIYGDAMERLWGGIDPIPQDRIEVIEDGATIDLGGRTLTAVETPGHAYHHHALRDDATGMLYCGDALGIKLPEVNTIRPTTPPPEFHLEKAIASIQRIKTVGAAQLCPTHFGPVDGDVNELCDAAVATLNEWAEWVREARERSLDLDGATAHVKARARAGLESTLPADIFTKMEMASSYWMNTWGYMRYFDKSEGA